MAEREIAIREKTPKKHEPLGNHPVDLSLDTLRGAIEYVVGQPVTLGLPYAPENRFDRDFTHAVIGRASFLAYGAKGSDDIWQFSFGDDKLKPLDPTWVYARGYLDRRDAYTSVDTREYSRIMVADSEVKPLGAFARESITQLLNVLPGEIAESGIDLANVSHSQARRIVDLMRSQYADGNWRETLQLALATQHIGDFVRMAREESYRDADDSVATVADDHIGKVLGEEYRTDIDLMLSGALRKGASELRASGRTQAAEHAEAWLSLHEESLTLDSFPPEVTIDDILTRPSYLNPRPDKGVPELAATGYLAGGRSSRNLTIKYPDGSIYAVDYPTHGHGARPIREKEEDGYSGNINEGTVRGFVHTDEWIDFSEAVETRVADSLVDEAMKRGVSFKKETKTYGDILRRASEFIDGEELDYDSETIRKIKIRFAALLMVTECVERTQTTVGHASSLYEFSVRGWGSKDKVENETGISLTLMWDNNLDGAAKQAYEDFGNSLYGYELARMAEAYAQHPEFSTHIATSRRNRELTENADYYYARMMEAAQRLVGRGTIGELTRSYFDNDIISSSPLALDQE